MEFKHIQNICDNEMISIEIEYIYDDVVNYYNSQKVFPNYNKSPIGFVITSLDRYNDNIKHKLKIYKRDIEPSDIYILIDLMRISRLKDKIFEIRTKKENIYLMQYLDMYKNYLDIYNSGQEIFDSFPKWAETEADVNKHYEYCKSKAKFKIDIPIQEINEEINNIVNKYPKEFLESLNYEFGGV